MCCSWKARVNYYLLHSATQISLLPWASARKPTTREQRKRNNEQRYIRIFITGVLIKAHHNFFLGSLTHHHQAQPQLQCVLSLGFGGVTGTRANRQLLASWHCRQATKALITNSNNRASRCIPNWAIIPLNRNKPPPGGQ